MQDTTTTPIDPLIEDRTPTPTPTIEHIAPRYHDTASALVCDFTGEKRAQLYCFDYGEKPLSFAVGPSRSALEAFDAAARAHSRAMGWVHFDELLAAAPAFFDGRLFNVRRSGKTEPEHGWKLAPNWRINWRMNTFRKLNGEPWYRVALEKDSMVRWTLVHELLELNNVLTPEAVPKFWAFLLLSEPSPEPNDVFLSKYAAAAWTLVNPSDAVLAGYKI